MRIGIDARELCGHATGVGRYLAGLLTQWSSDERARRHEFVLYAPDDLDLALDARHFATRLVAGPAGTWWEQVRLPAIARTRPSGRLLRARLHDRPAVQRADGGGDSRCLLRRAPRMVHRARRPSPPLADLPVGAARAPGADDLRVLAPRADRAPRAPERSDQRDSARPDVSCHRRHPPLSATDRAPACCTSDRSSTAGTCPIWSAPLRRSRGRTPAPRSTWSATTAAIREKISKAPSLTRG